MQPAPGELPQGGNAARVAGRSGVIWIACLSLFSSVLTALSYLRGSILSNLTDHHIRLRSVVLVVTSSIGLIHGSNAWFQIFKFNVAAIKVSWPVAISQEPGYLLISFALILVILILLLIRAYRLNQKLRKKERQHKEVNRRVVTAVNHTDTIIVSLNKYGIIRLVNESAILLHRNWVGSELKAGEKIKELTSGTEAEMIWDSWFQKSHNVHSWSEVCKLNIKGHLRYYRVNFSSIHGNNGEYTGLVMMGNDVTFEHEYQSELADQHRALEKSNSDKEQMMGILAHDLKDAIYSAHSMSKMVLEDAEDFDREHLLRLFEMLHDNFEKTQELLVSLLAWQKTRNVGTETRYDKIKLHVLVDEVISNSEGGIDRKELKVKNLIPENQMVTTDKEMLRTVLRNLLSNAIKFSHPKTGVVEFFCEENEGLEIHVRDQGVGMSEDEIKRLLSGSGGYSKVGTNKEKGSGIGLYLCQELLRINQSELQIKSKPEQGSDFYFKVRKG
jgi:signal transduction histidine kinase